MRHARTFKTSKEPAGQAGNSEGLKEIAEFRGRPISVAQGLRQRSGTPTQLSMFYCSPWRYPGCPAKWRSSLSACRSVEKKYLTKPAL